MPGVGAYDSATVSNLILLNIGTPAGPNQTFEYSTTFTVPYTNPSSTGIFQGTFEVEIVGRSNLFQTGTFQSIALSANLSTPVINGQIVAHDFGPNLGPVIYTLGGPSGLLVNSLDPGVNIGFAVNGGAFTSTLMDVTSQPAPSAVPLPAALPLFGAGLGMVGWLARRRKATAAAVAA